MPPHRIAGLIRCPRAGRLHNIHGPPEPEPRLGLDGKWYNSTPRHPDPAALKPQPARDGRDFWPTIDPRLHAALVQYVVPALPTRQIWECAAGRGDLRDELTAAGCEVLATDLYPPEGARDIGVCDFRRDPVPPAAIGRVAVTNPPGNQLDEFIARGLELFDRKLIAGFVLLLRLDHLQAGGRVGALNRATWEVHCNWRALWVPGTEDEQGRWSSHWILWLNEPPRKTLYLDYRDGSLTTE